MFGLSLNLSRSRAAVLGLALAAPSVALAQMAPEGTGDHHAGRASDTGFAGEVVPSGHYKTSVPLDLPSARGGLPVPVQVLYGGRRFGAAGLGWDVPLSSISRNVRLAHRRPANLPDTSPQAREQLTLTLNGGGIDLVRNGDDTGWVARRNDAQLEVRDVGGGVLEMYDGKGLRYSFSSAPSGASRPLDQGNYYLLQDIFGPGGTRMHLAYTFGSPTIAGSAGSSIVGLSIDLASVSYNYDPSGACARHEVHLVYDGDASSPLSLQMLGNTPLVRKHKLHAVDVKARETADDSSQPCSGAMKSLRTYNLDYQNDADTGQFQLRRVTMIGQEGKAERNVTLPVATYTYGQATVDGRLVYANRQTIPRASLPSTANTAVVAQTWSGPASFSAPHTNPPPTTEALTTQNLLDINGDGRPDFLFREIGDINAGQPFLTALLNKPDSIDPNRSVLSTNALGASPTVKFQAYQAQSTIRQMDVDGNGNNSVVWTQMVDMNADGRIDLLVANETFNAWVVYLNKPNQQDPNLVAWERHEIDIRPLLKYLPVSPATLVQGANGVLLPLSSTVTGHDQSFNHCWQQMGGSQDWSQNIDGYRAGNGTGSQCALPQGQDSSLPDFRSTDVADRTITQWELGDINGDGYPDLVYNTAAVTQLIGEVRQPVGQPVSHGQFFETHVINRFDLPPGTTVNAILNVAGVHLATAPDGSATATSAFSAPITLDTSCAVSRWSSDVDSVGRSSSTQECGFQDVNSDGLVDRVTFGSTARLGTGDTAAPFSSAVIQLPGPLSRSESQLIVDDKGHTRPAGCPATPTDGATYPIRRTNGLDDLNGDGIADYLAIDTGTNAWTVRFGTGAGFAAPLPIFPAGGGHFELSLEQVNCSNGVSGTAGGLYDFYGEGQATFVEFDNNGLNVYSLLDEGLAPLSAGLLTRIDNGYGASTIVAYRSAKEDAKTNHLVPAPEVVVTSVRTQDEKRSVFNLPTFYAYGSASQYFDPALDRWVFPGYRRRVSLQNTGDPNDTLAANAVITDAYPLEVFSFSPGLRPIDRLMRYLKVGRTSDVTKLSGELGIDPGALLTADIRSDPRRIAASHTQYDAGTARLPPAGKTGNEFCMDMLDPYDYTRSLDYLQNNVSVDQCALRGVLQPMSLSSWRGTPGGADGTADEINSPTIVQTLSFATAIDDFGRYVDTVNLGDLNDNSDDVCSHVDYATPTSSTGARVLNAVAQQTLNNCESAAIVKKRFEYDGFATTAGSPVGQVSSGFVTSSTVTRYDGDTHLSLGDIRLFDADLDATTGNPTQIRKTRDEDSARQGTNFTYDPFGLVVTRQEVFSTGTSFDILSTIFAHDPVTLNVTSTTDANGTVRGATNDGFGREVASTIAKPDGTGGILSSMTYSGFELIDTNGDGIPDSPDPALSGFRSISRKVFQDAVSNITLPGRTSTTKYDSFGRSGSTQLDLGANYPNKVVVSRSYDKLGRVNFESDPYEDNGSGRTLYGTTYNYNTDGTPSCFVRGPGTQPATFSVNETTEVYPTCFNHGFLSNQEFQDRGKADSFLDGSNQFHNFTRTLLTATGRILERDTLHNTGTAFTVLDKAVFTYDTLGHRTSMTRYRDPTNKMGAVTTTWHPDSLGWVTKQDKTGVATQTRIFDSWGNVTQVQWCDDMTAAPCPTKDRRSIARYDWLNRLIHREDQDSNSGGQPIAGTAVDLTYDANSGAIAGIPRNNMLGRLASATWSTGQEWFTYDSFGQVNSRTFIDTSVASNDHHYEIHEFHDDGSEKTLHLQIQDTNKQDEQVAYGYDSAARVNSMVYSFAGSSQNLFGPSGTSPIYDAFGRIINAKYGLASFNQSFANAGRRLPISLRMTSANGASTREIDFPTVNNVRAFDPIGRERQRVDLLDLIGEGGIPPTALLRSYDGLGRLSASQNFQISTQTTQADRSFSYDPLGNILTQTDANSSNPAGSVSLTYGVSDLDRVCGLAYWTATAPQSPNCNVNYDGVGNTVSMPMRSGATRTLDWFPNGAVKRINSVGSNANFAYDAFGGLQQLTVDTILADRRADKYFGRYIKQRIEGAQSVINRRIPVPGLVATRHGPTGGWTFAFGDGRGTRFVTDQTGAFVQDVNYHPFGEVKFGAGAVPGGTNYTSEQWNGGDLLSTLGVVNLGARVYDPVIGRFLSRDPILQAKNPYAFASNDPINRSDASGMMDSCGNGGGFQAIGVFTGCDDPASDIIFTGATSVPNNPDGLTETPGGCPANSSCADHLPGSFTCTPDGKDCTDSVIEVTDCIFCKPSGPLLPLTPPHGHNSFVPPDNFGVDILARWGRPACRGNVACPAHWEGTTPPPGFGPYFSRMGELGFHCGGHVFVETGCESSGLFFWESTLHGECNYASDTTCGVRVGELITQDNPLCGGCYGNADRFDSNAGLLDFIGHAGFDEGGPTFGGHDHYMASFWHSLYPNEPPPDNLIFGVGIGY